MRHLIKTSNLILLQLVLAASVIASGLENAAAATDLTRVEQAGGSWQECADIPWKVQELYGTTRDGKVIIAGGMALSEARSEEHTSELQSRGHLVCRLLLEKKK